MTLLIEKLLKDSYSSRGSVLITASSHWKKGYNKLKFKVKKGAKTVTVEVPTHWGNFLKFCELVWRMSKDVEIG